MFRNYVKSALRSIKRSKFNSLLVVFCLLIGFTTFLVTMNYVFFESNYDTFHKDAGNIYRLVYKTYKGGELYQYWAPAAGKLGPGLKDNFSEVEDYTRIRFPAVNAGQHVVSYKLIKYREESVYFGDSTFFNVFSFRLKKGDPKTALSQIKSVVITEAIAKKYFGDEDPINKILKFEHKNVTYTCFVTGVLEDIPENSHMKFDMLLPIDAYYLENPRNTNETWWWISHYTYVKLKPGTDIASFKERLNVFAEKNAPEWKKKTYKITYDLEPLLDIHLESAGIWDIAIRGNKTSLYFLIILSICTIFISWINYINFSTSKIIERAKEVSIRKVLGSSKEQQTLQFLIEPLLINIISLVASIALTLIIIPLVNNIIGKSIEFLLFNNFRFLLIFSGIILSGILLTSLYPVFVISSFNPAAVLKGRQSFSQSKTGSILRSGLVVFQFIMALCIIIGTFSIFLQIRYMKNEKLGFDKDKVFVIKGPILVNDSTFQNRYKTFKKECEKYSNIDKITMSSEVPGKQITWNTYIVPLESDDANTGESFMQVYIDEDFFKVYKLELIAGRNFTKLLESDSNAVIVNEAGLEKLKIRSVDDAFKHIYRTSWKPIKIIGVVKNYHQESLKVDYSPTAFYANTGYSKPHFISIRLNSGNIEETISFISQKWTTYFPDTPMDYYFMDTFYDMQYADDYKFSKLFTILSAISILLSCLGILGLTYLHTTKRTKEIGIRKVLGANVEKILSILLKDILKLIGIAIFIGWPISYFIMNSWLQNYANRISMPWIVFLAGGVSLLIITLLTVSYHTIKAALQNPTASLNEE